MSKSRRSTLVVSLVLLGAVISAIVIARRSSSEAERLERQAINARWKRAFLEEGLARIAPSFYSARGRQAAWQYEDSANRIQNQLLSTGYLEKRTFQFQHGTGSWRAFDAAVSRTLSWRELWECSYRTAESSVVIVARSTRMTELQQLVGRYDKPPPH